MNHPAKDPGEISDGYHTFNELYSHRAAFHWLVIVAIGVGMAIATGVSYELGVKDGRWRW